MEGAGAGEELVVLDEEAIEAACRNRNCLTGCHATIVIDISGRENGEHLHLNLGIGEVIPYLDGQECC